jgi:hypothetical protein
MEVLASMIVIIPLIVFWLWMFRDMTNNDRLPGNSAAPLSWPPKSKYTWTLAFIFMNVFAAIFYYFYEHRTKY